MLPLRGSVLQLVAALWRRQPPVMTTMPSTPAYLVFVIFLCINHVVLPHPLDDQLKSSPQSESRHPPLLSDDTVRVPLRSSENNFEKELSPIYHSLYSRRNVDESQNEHGQSFPGNDHNITSRNHTKHDNHAIHVASWQWDYVRTPFIYTTVVIVAGLCKVGFHHAGFLSSIIPESCMLIILGIAVGAIVHFTHSREVLPEFTPKGFFLFLLPPIVLESAYSLHDRAFFANLGTIILYAVLGTLISCFTIGPTLYALVSAGVMGSMQLAMVECLVFSALISAVDPVAVLAIFQEVGVNKSLYFLVFGESLLNDAVTIVLYMMMVGFSKAEYITVEQVGTGVAAFICVSLGGLAIGVAMGVITALITKHTKEVRVVEPLAMLGIAYLSYLTAEMIHFSGIISIIGCGIVQAHYASKNISQKSNTTVKYFTKMVSAVCDTVIFLFLGMVLVDDKLVWHTGFVLWSTGLCLVYRFMAVFLLTYIANKLERTHRINMEEQFIMAYGGLRGAVAFSLVVMLDEIEHRHLFITATLFIILFTVFIQGGTIKPLVIFLKIRRQAAKTEESMFTEVNKKLLDHVMAGVEEVTGDHGDNYWKQMLFYYNNKYLKRWLQCKGTESNLSRVYTRMMLEDHFAHLYGPATAIEDKKPLLLNRVSGDEPEEMLEGLPALKEEEEEEQQEENEDDIFKPSNAADQETKPLRSKQDQGTEVPSTGPTPLLKRQTTLSLFKKQPPAEESDTTRLLHKALLDNPYNKLHHKYNPNLVDDEVQDMNAHLRARRLRARRLTLLALHGASKPSTAAPSGEQKDGSSGSMEDIPASTKAAVCYFLERAQKRRSLRKEPLQRAATVGETPASAAAKSQKLERQRAVSDCRDLSAISEEDSSEAESRIKDPSEASETKV